MKYKRLGVTALAALLCVSQMPTEAYALEDNSKNRATAPYVLSDSDMDSVYAGVVPIIPVVIGGLAIAGIVLYVASRKLDEQLQKGAGFGLSGGFKVVQPSSYFPEDISIRNPSPR